MNTNVRKYGLPAIKAIMTLAFVAAGLAKLASAEMMVATFDAVGVGQWLRYVTGIFEVGGAILLWVPGKQLYGAGLLAVTMTGAVLSHLFILGHRHHATGRGAAHPVGSHCLHLPRPDEACVKHHYAPIQSA